MTPRQRLINHLSYKIYEINHDAWLNEINQPSPDMIKNLERMRKMLRNPDALIAYETLTDNVFSPEWAGLVEGVVRTLSQDVMDYYMSTSDIAYKKVALAAYRQAEKRLDIDKFLHHRQNRRNREVV